MRAPDQEARNLAVQHKQHNVLVQAGAGSGKTTTLMARLERILSEESASLARIVAITFTEKAAEELKARLRSLCDGKLAEEGSEAWSRHRQAVETAHIGTIHGFCSRLLRVHALRMDLDPYFTVLDEAEASLLLADSVREHVLQQVRAGSASTRALVEALGFDRACAAFRAAARLRGRRELEGLPTTATDVLSRWQGVLEDRAAWQVARLRNEPRVVEAAAAVRRVKPLDDSDKLAEVQREVAALLEVALAEDLPTKEAAQAWSGLRAVRKPGNIGSRKSWPEGAVPDLRAAIVALREAASVVCPARENDEVEESAAALTAHFCAVLPEALEAYEAAKRGRSALDFDDLLILARNLLRDQPAIRRAEQKRFDHILVDEFQDTDPIQREVIWYLAEEGARATLADEVKLTPGKLFLVGDAKQSIYLFRGADVTVYDQTQREFKGDPACDTISLTANFRSQPRLVAFFNGMFGCPEVMGPDHENRRAFEAFYEPLEATREAPQTGLDVSFILAVSEDQPIEELRVRAAAGIASYIARHVRDRSLPIAGPDETGGESWRPAEWKDFMILLPTMTGVRLYEEGLREHGVPYHVVSGRGFYGRPEILDITRVLKVLDDPRDEVALARALRSPCFCVSDEGLYWIARGDGLANGLAELAAGEPQPGSPLTNLSTTDADRSRRAADVLATLRAERDRLSLSELVCRALDLTGLPAVVAARFDGQRAYANLQKLVDIAHGFGARESPSLSRFVEYAETVRLEEIREAEAPAEEEQGNAVTLMTIHKAKGLEKPVVVVADLTGGGGHRASGPVLFHPQVGPVLSGEDEQGERRFPAIGEAAKRELDDRETAEDKRLLYVALTRARDRLVISAPVKLKKGGARPRGVYLDALLSALGDQLLDGQAPAASGPPGEWTSEVVVVTEPVAVPTSAPRSGALLHRYREEIEAGRPLPGGEAQAEEEILRRLPPVAPEFSTKGRFTVTELTTYLRCPRCYELRYVRQLAGHIPPTSVAGEGKLKPFERGNVVHRALQRLGRGPATDLRGLVEASLRECGLAGHGPEELWSIIPALVRFTRSATWKQIEAADELRSEVPFVARFEGGLLEGQVDALLRDAAGGLHLVDYKTGRAGDAGSQAEHVFQVGAYAAALVRCGGTLPASVAIHYLASEQRVEVNPEAGARESASRAEEAMSGIRQAAFPPATDCRPAACAYGWLCGQASEPVY